MQPLSEMAILRQRGYGGGYKREKRRKSSGARPQFFGKRCWSIPHRRLAGCNVIPCHVKGEQESVRALELESVWAAHLNEFSRLVIVRFRNRRGSGKRKATHAPSCTMDLRNIRLTARTDHPGFFYFLPVFPPYKEVCICAQTPLRCLR